MYTIIKKCLFEFEVNIYQSIIIFVVYHLYETITSLTKMYIIYYYTVLFSKSCLIPKSSNLNQYNLKLRSYLNWDEFILFEDFNFFGFLKNRNASPHYLILLVYNSYFAYLMSNHNL